MFIGVVIAAAVVSAFFFQNLRPLLSADEQLALKNAEIARKEALIQKNESILIRQENDRVQKEIKVLDAALNNARNEFTALSNAFDERVSEAVTSAKSEVKDLRSQLVNEQNNSTTKQVEEKLVRAEQNLAIALEALTATEVQQSKVKRTRIFKLCIGEHSSRCGGYDIFAGCGDKYADREQSIMQDRCIAELGPKATVVSAGRTVYSGDRCGYINHPFSCEI